MHTDYYMVYVTVMDSLVIGTKIGRHFLVQPDQIRLPILVLGPILLSEMVCSDFHLFHGCIYLFVAVGPKLKVMLPDLVRPK